MTDAKGTLMKTRKTMPLFEKATIKRHRRRQQPPEVRVLAVSHVSWNAENAHEGGRPYIRLKGKWLAQAGFAAGTRVAVTVRRGRLTITPYMENAAHARNGR